MRLFQNFGVYPTYLAHLHRMVGKDADFEEQIAALLKDRFSASHILMPVLDGDCDAFFTNGTDEKLQHAWARENGLQTDNLDEILLAQIEAHRTEVFYNIDPMRFGSAFLRRLPGSVKTCIAWRAAPSQGIDLGAYNLVVCNFPGILQRYADEGLRAAYFFPAHDPEMDSYAANQHRPIDVLFVGGYTRHHGQRTQLLDAVAAMSDRFKVVMHLDRSRLTRLAETPFGILGPLGKHRRSNHIRAVSRPAIFGRALYEALSQSKIALNGAIDMAGEDRGNIRCFEGMGCGCLMLSDTGRYPAGMMAGKTMETYESPEDAVAKISTLLVDTVRLEQVARAGYEMVSRQYSKQRQWDRFLQFV